MSTRAIAFSAVLLVVAACSATQIDVAKPRTLRTTDAPTDEFTAKDQNGNPVSLAAALSRGVTVLVFYRGHW